MKLWRISRPDRNDWDEYDSAIVAAETADEARLIHPGGHFVWREMTPDEARDNFMDAPSPTWLPPTPNEWAYTQRDWPVEPAQVLAEHVGEALPETPAGTVLCASFNAG